MGWERASKLKRFVAGLSRLNPSLHSHNCYRVELLLTSVPSFENIPVTVVMTIRYFQEMILCEIFK